MCARIAHEQVDVVGTPMTCVLAGKRGAARQHAASRLLREHMGERTIERRWQNPLS